MTEQADTPDWELIATKLAWTLSQVLPNNAQRLAQLFKRIENNRERIAWEEENGISSMAGEVYVDARLGLLLPDEHAALMKLVKWNGDDGRPVVAIQPTLREVGEPEKTLRDLKDLWWKIQIAKNKMTRAGD